MRTNWAALATLLLLTSTIGVAAEEGTATTQPKINWVKDLETAMKLSHKDGRPVIAYFTFDACVWCKRLEKSCFDDAKVVELSRRFHFVKVNRDRTPAIPKRLNVFAYPSLLTLGKKEENIYRFQSYQQPPEFIGNLEAALQRYSLYKGGKDWMLPPKRPNRLFDQGQITQLQAPSKIVPAGLTVLDGSIWVAQGQLFQIDATSGRVIAKRPLPSSVGDLCTDGKHLFAVTYGWTAGKPIYQIDPASGKTVREIVTESNKKNRSHGAKGIAWHDGSLYVLSGMVGKVFQVDVTTGKILSETQLEGQWLSGLDFQGSHFLTGGRTDLWRFDSKTGKLLQKTACNYPLRNVAALADDVLMMEQPIFGFGRRHERMQVWPQKTSIYRFSADNKRP